MKNVAEGTYSPSLSTWSMVPQKGGTEHSFSNSSSQQNESADVCEKGTQTNTADDEAILQSVSSSTQYGWQDHFVVIEGEMVSRPKVSTTKTGGTSLPLDDDEEFTRMMLLEEQVEQLKEYDIPALRKQLQDANIDLNKWKERALAAEKKARLFEKFTTRVRHLHSSLVTESSQQSGDDESAVREGRDAEGFYLVHSVRFNKSLETIKKGARTTEDQNSRGVEDDGGVVAAGTFDSLYPRMRTREEGSSSGDSKTTATGDALLSLHGMDGVMSPRDDEEELKIRHALVELWMAVQELLRMEDEETSSSSSSSSQHSSTCTEDETSLGDQYL